MKISYKPIPGFDGYLAGSNGRVYSQWVRYRIPGRKGSFAKIDKGAIPRKLANNLVRGYPHVTMKSSETDKIIYLSVATVVCLAFHGLRPAGLECSHKDGNRLNSLPSNLIWETTLENNKRKFKHGTVISGENHYRAKLTKADLLRIDRLLSKIKKHGFLMDKIIGKKFGIAGRTIYRIRTGRHYSTRDKKRTK